MGHKVLPITLDHLAELREDPDLEVWVSTMLREWGSCGRIALVDDRPVGLVLYAPPGLVPEQANLALAAVGEDAVVMIGLWVEPEHRNVGIGRGLVRAMAADVLKREGYRAIEAFGGPSAPSDFLALVGFKTVRRHPTAPRMRMELRTLVTWREDIEDAVERIVGIVRPRKTAMPQHREGTGAQP
jgi:GNAT superfamily N-acetyltransferase